MAHFDKRGGHNRYECNYNFFKTWSPGMAYVLGFLYADGCVINAHSSRICYVKFTSGDSSILELVKNLMGSKHPLQCRAAQNIQHKNGVYKSKEVFDLRIGSRKMYNDLLALGLTPKKSKSIEFPEINSKFLPHFVRGYFDGDGCASLSYRKNKNNERTCYKLNTIFISGSEKFLTVLKDILRKEAGTSADMHIYFNNRAYRLAYATGQSINLFKYFYENAGQMFLERKFNVYKKFFSSKRKWIDKNIEIILKENKNMARYPNG